MQATFLSGRYRTEEMCRHWSSNTNGYCLLPVCSGLNQVEDIKHILASCRSLSGVRQNLVNFTIQYSEKVPFLADIILKYTNPNNPWFFQFMIDCSTIPEIISTSQLFGKEIHYHLFKVTRTWCYSLHRERMRLLGRWQPF